MSEIGEELEVFLQTKSAVTDLIGTRIRPEVLDESEALPAITHSVISSQHETELEGAAGIRHTRLQVDCYAATKVQASAVAEQVRLAVLAGVRTTWGGTFINDVTVDRSFTSRDAPTDGSGNWRYVHILEFLISHAESVPA